MSDLQDDVLVQLGLRRPTEEGGETRRDFLALLGYGAGAAALAACRAPVQRAVPLANASEDVVPGVATHYATSCGGCPSGCALVVKQRDGRPIKIEGNPAAPLFGGGTCATGQATVLSLYDEERLRGPLWHGRPSSWREIDRRVVEALAAAGDRQVVLLSGTMTSPSLREIVARWRGRFPGFRHVEHDPVSASALLAAGARDFGRAAVPHLDLERARVIVGIDADFLGTWLSPVELARAYARGRRPEAGPSLHVQIEPGVSVTGESADVRLAVAPSELGAAAVALVARVARLAGEPEPLADATPEWNRFDRVAEELWRHRGRSVVVAGTNDVDLQTVVNALNHLLGNVGATVDFARPSLQRRGDDAAFAQLLADMEAGRVAALVIHGRNPGYDGTEPARFLAALERVPLSVSLGARADETGVRVDAVCPDHHFLESWGDVEPVEGWLGLRQPLIAPLFETRAAADSLLRWIGDETDAHAQLRSMWRERVFPRVPGASNFETFWDAALERGFVDLGAPPAPAAPAPRFQGDWRAAARRLMGEHRRSLAARRTDRYELALFEGVPLRDGRHANNPWLQELPDPITKVTWGNVAAIAPALADAHGLADGDVIVLDGDVGRLELPVVVVPGQERRTISVALGYGRARAGKAGDGVGVNAFPFGAVVDGFRRTSADGVTVTKTGRRETLARAQGHFAMEGRPIALEATADELEAGAARSPEPLADLWPPERRGDHAWGLAIDLGACTGCSACVVACQAENNVPVVGKDQVQRQRIMHWIRIDRYVAGGADAPRVLHQPMMCQHCGHAPCETVCPVLATTRSSEGLNQQVYNRCIGTRYCANNCPYKVRRFNWYNYTQNPRFDFNMANPVGRLVLNPDVTVRSRGVMEKCSLCVQRIQSAKHDAARTGRRLADGDIETACAQACPTSAIQFGDLADPDSRVARLRRSPRAYRVLEELGTRPSVHYLKKVRHADLD